MFEEFDYSEEYRHEPSESASAEWVRCLVSGMRPGYEDVKKMAAKEGKKLTRKQYEKACRDLGLKG